MPQSDPPLHQSRLPRISASAVTSSEKSSVIANRKSSTRFPTSYRWIAYVTHNSPKRWLKKWNGRLQTIFYISVIDEASDFKFNLRSHTVADLWWKCAVWRSDILRYAHLWIRLKPTCSTELRVFIITVLTVHVGVTHVAQVHPDTPRRCPGYTSTSVTHVAQVHQGTPRRCPGTPGYTSTSVTHVAHRNASGRTLARKRFFEVRTRIAYNESQSSRHLIIKIEEM